LKAKQEILDNERLTVARRRAEKAEQEQQVLEHRPTSCRSRPADVPADFCTPTGLYVAEGTGLSRATARRYLEYLEAQGRAAMELRFGSAGRSEHRYRLAD
jgi:response regulator of citrate/malate metabolism